MRKIRKNKKLDLGYFQDMNLPVDLVKLPSRGKIYGPDNYFCDKAFVDFKPMTAKQEDILLNASYRKKGKTIEEMISSCLLEPGIDLDDLLTGDRDALMVSIRISGYGSGYEPTYACPQCEHKNDLNFDLTTIGIKFLELEPHVVGQNLFKFVLPKSKHEVLFRFITVADERNLLRLLKKEDSGIGTVTAQLLNSIVQIDGRTDLFEIQKFIQKMSAYDSSHLRAYINKHQPGLDMNLDFQCNSCAYSSKINIPTNHDFFSLGPEHREIVFLEPFFLLGYYFGMDYKTYYNLPIQYRRWLIERINKEIKTAVDANKKGGSEVPSRAAHHNDPTTRAFSGKQRAVVPSKLQRFT